MRTKNITSLFAAISTMTCLLFSTTGYSQSLSDIAGMLEKKIYSTMPKDQAEAMFKQATSYATNYLSRDLVQEQRQTFANSFADNYTKLFINSLSNEFKMSLTENDLENMRQQLAKQTQKTLEASEEKQLALVEQALSHCSGALKADVVALFAVGQDQTFSAKSTMPNTANCLIEESDLSHEFAKEMQPHQSEVEESLWRYLRQRFSK